MEAAKIGPQWPQVGEEDESKWRCFTKISLRSTVEALGTDNSLLRTVFNCPDKILIYFLYKKNLNNTV